VRIVISSIGEFLAGEVIPLPFFPQPFRQFVELLPFASMQNVPLRIYNGDLTGFALVSALLLQAFWLVLLIVIGKIWLQQALKRVVVQGG
jgi:ABC-2 type transport system permease protein